MIWNLYRSTAASTLALLGLAAAAPASAQSKMVTSPAEKFVMTPGGVDMRTGRYIYNETDLTIGGGDKPLALTRTTPVYAGAHANPFGNFSSNWDIMLLETRVDLNEGSPAGLDYRMHVFFGGNMLTFEGKSTSPGFGYVGEGPTTELIPDEARDSASVKHMLKASDGTVVHFRAMGSADCGLASWYLSASRCAFASRVQEPDGTVYDLEYADVGGDGNRSRLRLVTSSRGYALLLEPGTPGVAKACVFDLSRTPLPADQKCPSTAPTATYEYGGIDGARLTGVTNPAGEKSTFNYTGTAENFRMSFVKPGTTTPWLVNWATLVRDDINALTEVVNRQEFADGQIYSYSLHYTPITNNKPNPTIAGGFYYDKDGKVTEVRWAYHIQHETHPGTPCRSFPCDNDEPVTTENYGRPVYQQTPGPETIIDSLERTTRLSYCDPVVPATYGCFVTKLQSFTDPEGITTKLKYDGWNNISEVARYAKPGNTVLDPIVTKAEYACINNKTCTKPTRLTDARNNTTVYEYWPEHGGIKLERQPPVNGVSPEKRYFYTERRAWVLNGSGGYKQMKAAPDPGIWLLSEIRACKASAMDAAGNCTGGDSIVTAYDYGPDSGPNTLLLRGMTVTADGQTLRTCYGYDALGRKISETTPEADLVVCP
jgi:YD repeat-containing protein